MKSNYEPLGKHIRLVDYRNSEEVTSTVLGISIDKEFMPSVANVIGTDLSRYKLISKGLFACNPMHVGRDERLPIALYEKDNAAIVSPAYFMFEIIDRDVLNEEYLMMWFRRPEFDRECWFMTDGSVRGGISWDDLCRIQLPVPPYERQLDVVESYRAITRRIAMKKEINDNLAATLDALFSELYGQLNDDDSVSLDTVCSLASSKRVFADDYSDMGVPFYGGKEITLKQAGQPIIEPLYIEKEHFTSLKEKYGIPMKGDILITAVGTIGNSYLVRDEEFYFKDGNIIWLKDFKGNLNYYVYDFMQTKIFKQMLDGICIGSTQTALTIVALSNLQIKIPDSRLLNEYTKQSMVVRTQIELNTDEISHLYELQAILLAELSR